MIYKARPEHAPSILQLVNTHAESGLMLFRTLDEIQNHLAQFLVYEMDGKVVATCALSYSTTKLVEIRSLAVDQDYARRGIGAALIEYCLQEAVRAEAQKIFVLTYVAPLFKRFGFEVIDKNLLPEKIWKDCQTCFRQDHCNETAMIRDLVVSVQPLETLPSEPESLPLVGA